MASSNRSFSYLSIASSTSLRASSECVDMEIPPNRRCGTGAMSGEVVPVRVVIASATGVESCAQEFAAKKDGNNKRRQWAITRFITRHSCSAIGTLLGPGCKRNARAKTRILSQRTAVRAGKRGVSNWPQRLERLVGHKECKGHLFLCPPQADTA